jgi:hypothetical protein
MGAFSLCQDTRSGAAFIVADAATCEVCEVEAGEGEGGKSRRAALEVTGSRRRLLGLLGLLETEARP